MLPISLPQELVPILIEEEMQRSYLDYAMSVIVSRALPDVRDGLKPVHRRILYAMLESHCEWNKPHRKSARIVGEVMGKYHPHGGDAIYLSLVRMAQNFAMRVPLIDGQGNFGSMDGDAPAAQRYTEARLAKIAHNMLADIEKDTVDFRDNYDGSEREPVVLPSQFPHLLINGAGGIAVGMATNIPPHNLGEVIDACCLYIDNPDATEKDILDVMPAPDFPTGGIIMGRNGSYSAMTTGRGSVIIRGKTSFEDIHAGKQAIIIHEVPYQVNKAQLVTKIAELVRDKRIDGITDLRDESDRIGVRVVIELRRDVTPEVVLNQLYRYSPLQTSFGVNMLALHDGQPKLMNVKQIILAFLAFREEVLVRRTKFLLRKARERAHILIGLSVAVANIDEVITLIRNAPDPATARAELMERQWKASHVEPFLLLVADNYNTLHDGSCLLTEAQARAILEMKLARLTGLEQNKIQDELTVLAEEMHHYMSLLRSRPMLLAMLKEELLHIKKEFATPRLSIIEENECEHDIEDLIQKEDRVVIVTMGGYVKCVPLSSYRSQRRGGKGRSGMRVNEEDVTLRLFVANTHTPVLFFSNLGKVYKLKVYKLPVGNPQAKGRALVNIFPLAEGEFITNVMPFPEDQTSLTTLSILFCTAKGNVRRSAFTDFLNVASNGKIAIRLDEDDALVSVLSCSEKNHVLLVSHKGKSIRFTLESLRIVKSRTSDGVRGMRLTADDKVISGSILEGVEVTDMNERDSYLSIPLETRINIASAASQEEVALALGSIAVSLPHETIKKLADKEEFILSLTENGFGKRSSAYEYKITARGGQGIINIVTSARNGPVAASFPVKTGNHIMVMTDQGTLLRCPVEDIRIAGRVTQGVVIFRKQSDEKVVSAALIEGNDSGEEESETGIAEVSLQNTDLG